MNTKRIIFSLSLLAVALFSSAQDYFASQIAYNSLSMSQTNPILGTARYSGMGGAMGALGGDAGTMKDNPAGLGVYRNSDITLTPNVYISNDNSVGLNINNFAVVLNFGNSGNRTGYVTSSLGIGYSRLKNFERHSNLLREYPIYSMTDQIYMMESYAQNDLYKDAHKLGLVDDMGYSLFAYDEVNGYQDINAQTLYTELGSIGEWNLSYGVNISNFLYFGASAGFVSLDYELKALYEEWAARDNREYWNVENAYSASGSGFNLKLGAIVAITDFMRAGLAFHTPTFYNIDEYTSEDISYMGDYATDTKREDFFNSDLQTPLKLQGSLGFIINKMAIIGLEYQFEDFSAMRFSSGGALHQSSKNLIGSKMKVTHTAKVGAEVKVIDGLSLRAGFAFVSGPSAELSNRVSKEPQWFQAYPLAQPKNTFYYTGGIGYRGEYFYADLAYVHQIRNETFFEYLPLVEDTPYDLKLHNNNIMATVGFCF